MTEKALEILEEAFRYSLWAFLILFSVWVFIRAFGARAAAGGEASGPSRLSATRGDMGALLRAVAVCALGSLAVFVVLILTPLPFIDNFANSESWKLERLRLTHMILQRESKGFILEGEVYNQTAETMEGILAVVRIWGIDQQLLAELPASLDPEALESNQSARFRVRYREEPPILYGYEVVFRDSEGIEIPHTEGFDVRPEDQNPPEAPAAPIEGVQES